MISVYVEHRVGDIAIGYTYFQGTNDWQLREQVGVNRLVECVNVDDVPEGVKKAVDAMLA